MAGKVPCPACGKQYTWKPEFAGRKGKCKCGAILTFPNDDPDALAEAAAFDAVLRDIEPHERTPSGAPIYRHEARTKPFEVATGDSDTIQAISDHIERHVGKVAGVFHEIVSDLVHIDIHMVEPTDDKPWWTLVTSGMSDLPMTVPDGEEFEEHRFAELVICLPRDWPMEQEAWSDESNYWPIRWLKQLARMPHEYETWLGVGHTVPNGDPPEPFAPQTNLCCMLMLPPVLANDEFPRLDLPDGRVINFLGLYPLYKEEMDFKLKHGADDLVERFDKEGVTELLAIDRKNVCKKRFGLF